MNTSKPLWQLQRTVQCSKCPWRKDVDPHDIPDGYDEQKHQALKTTIADANDPMSQLANLVMHGPSMRVMACHETKEAHCLGWLINQLGPGNNLPLRMSMRSCGNIRQVKLQGEQHARFEDTLPQA